MATNTKSVYETLSAINVNDKTEKKNGLTYLSWAFAWGELLKHYPNSTYTIYENEYGFNYFTDGKTCWVKAGVTVEGKELIEYLPVMDFRNKSITVDAVTSFDVNKTIQRSLTKAIARHGLGLYIYAGEDLPEESKPEPQKVTTPNIVEVKDNLTNIITKAIADCKTLTELTALSKTADGKRALKIDALKALFTAKKEQLTGKK